MDSFDLNKQFAHILCSLEPSRKAGKLFSPELLFPLVGFLSPRSNFSVLAPEARFRCVGSDGP